MLAAEVIRGMAVPAGLVLLSAHDAGADAYWRACRARHVAVERADEILAQARELVARDDGERLLPLPNCW
jgi:hypothetical protein